MRRNRGMREPDKRIVRRQGEWLTLAAVATAVLVTLATTTPRAAAAQSREVPIEYEDTRVYVPVRVDTQPPRWFILDTGAQPIVFDVAVAAVQPGTVAAAAIVRGAGSGSMRQGFLSPIPLHVGGVTLVPPRIAVSPIDSLLAPFTGRRAPGILGSQLFTGHVVVLDIAARHLELHDTAGYRYRGRGIELPLRITGGIPSVAGAITLPDGRRLPMRFLVDLGAKATLLVAEPFIEAHGLRASLPAVRRASLGAGVGGETRYDFARLPQMDVGTRSSSGTALVSIAEPVVGFSVQGTLSSDRYDALLGAGFLERYRVIFDYARHRMILEPRFSLPPRDEFDMSGAFMIADGPTLDRFVVHGVDADSPAAESGVQVGDVVLAANGRAADQLSLDQLRRLLRGGPGRDVTLVLRRGATTVTRTLRLRTLL